MFMNDLVIMTGKMINYSFIFAILFIFLPFCIFILHKNIEEYYIEKYSKVSKNGLTIESQRKAEKMAFLISIPIMVLWHLILLKNIFEWMRIS